MYYGDEIGMEDVFIPAALRIDPWGINKPDTDLGRDPERTPMQWDSSANAGFTSGKPWLPLANNYPAVNVAAQLANGRSTFNFYKQLLSLRRSQPALHRGTFTFLDNLPEEVLAFVREANGVRLLVCLNFGAAEQTIDLRHMANTAKTMLSTHFRQLNGTTVTLQPHESILFELN
jgi:alpha-glucosidase